MMTLLQGYLSEQGRLGSLPAFFLKGTWVGNGRCSPLVFPLTEFSRVEQRTHSVSDGLLEQNIIQ